MTADPAAVAEALGRAFEEAARALEAQDAVAANEAMAIAAEQCLLAERLGLQLSPDSLERLKALHARCTMAADGLRTTLGASMVQAGTSRRASDAYRED